MTAQLIHTETGPTRATEATLYRTVGGARLHIEECPHILGVDVAIDYAASSGGGAARQERRGENCACCGLEMPLTGRCDDCD